MQITIDITPQRIASIMITAIEGNHMTRAWCDGVFLEEQNELHIKQFDSPWYSDARLYDETETTGLIIRVDEIVDESKPVEGNNIRPHRVEHRDFIRAFTTMAKDYPRHFADFMNENEDIITADVFLQLLALGDVVYG